MEQTLCLEGFTRYDFETFDIPGLEGRMAAIEERIRPKFRAVGETLVRRLSAGLDADMFLHIAKHARRTVNPPRDTWLAVSADRRGYKKHPHFQFGLFKGHAFIWLAFIYELPGKENVARRFLDNPSVLAGLPGDFVVSADHMQENYTPLRDTDVESVLKRFRDVKKSEFLIGRCIAADQPVLSDGAALLQAIENTYDALIPSYQLAQE